MYGHKTVRKRNSQYYCANFVGGKFPMTEESLSSYSIKFVITKQTYQNFRNTHIMELLFMKKEIPDNFVLKPKAGYIGRNTESNLT